YYEAAEARKAAILNSPTQIIHAEEMIPGETYTGTAYYISNNGDDNNDGLTPETAWRTCDPINPRACKEVIAELAENGIVIPVPKVTLQPGDAVFFERGSVFRLTDQLVLASGVTYSAYGEGAKPVFTAAEENSARPECWALWYEGENGEKIWRFYKEMYNACGIVFDDETYAKRVWEWPTPEGWLAVELRQMDPVNGICAPEDPSADVRLVSAGEYRTVDENLSGDLTFLFRPDLEGLRYPVQFDGWYKPGDIYLRCDSGNPGEIYSDIEVIALPDRSLGAGLCVRAFDAEEAQDYVLDNLSIKYYGDSAVFGNMKLPGAVIQNCTVEFGGTRILRVESAEPTSNFFAIGDGIYCVTGAEIRNCYFRHSGNAFTFENAQETADHLGSYHAYGNLIENCGQGIRTYLINPDGGRFDELILRDNIVLNSGDSMNNACFESPTAIDLGSDLVQYAGHIEVCDNVLIGSRLSMLKIPDVPAVKLDIHDNVIAQSHDGVLINEMQWDRSGQVTWHMMSDAK
ncbi:hypothetical protein, partial [uncultured Mailhella sp.]|uniref:hypothetical protein n=1 Tax=uncultured Mailhella sp. TaxID=1981031 RepID=UPI0026121B94